MIILAQPKALRAVISCIPVLAASSLPGCALPGPEIKFVGVNLVNRATEREIPGWHKGNVLERPDQPALRINVSSKTDLVKYADKVSTLRGGAQFCDAKNRLPDVVGQPAPQMAWPDLYAGDVNITSLVEKASSESRPALSRIDSDSTGLFQYHFYVRAFVLKKGSIYLPREQEYDLTKNAHDPCSAIGVTYLSWYTVYRSNTARIPADLIRAVFEANSSQKSF